MWETVAIYKTDVQQYTCNGMITCTTYTSGQTYLMENIVVILFSYVNMITSFLHRKVILLASLKSGNGQRCIQSDNSHYPQQKFLFIQNLICYICISSSDNFLILST